MPQSHILKLSQEIIDEILDYFHPEVELSTWTAPALALTCRGFLPRCQMLIFSTIRFYSNRAPQSDACSNRIQDFHDILQRSPYIAGYVRALELTIASFNNSWVTEDLRFIKIMETIRQSGNYIRKLSIHGASFPEKFSDARTLEQNFLQPFITPFITSLEIQKMMSIPRSLLANSVNLKDLTIHYSDVEAFTDHLDMSLLQTSLPKIQNLTFNPFMGVIGAILKANCDPGIPPIADFTCLRTLRTYSNHHNMEALQNIIEIAGSSLEEFYLLNDESEVYQPRVGSIDFSHASCLRVLDIDVVFATNDPLVDLCGILQTIPVQNSLGNFNLNADLEHYGTIPERCFLVAWELLDSEIARISLGKPLKFHLHMVYPLPDSDSDEEEDGNSGNFESLCEATFQRLVQERFPKISDAPHIILTLSKSLTAD